MEKQDFITIEPSLCASYPQSGQKLYLEYKQWGVVQETKPSLLFLHEGLGSVSLWRDFPEKVAQDTGCCVFAVSRAGYGKSSPARLPRPVSYLEDEALAVLPAVRKALNLGRVILVGHSDGGSISLIHAARYSQDGLLCGALVMAPHVFNEALSIQGVRAAREIWEAERQQVQEEHAPDRSPSWREKLQRHHGDNVDIAFHGWNDTWLREDFAHWNIEHYLPQITCPVTAIQGAQDEYGTARQVETVIAQSQGPGKLLLIPDVGHAPHKDRPDIIIAELRT